MMCYCIEFPFQHVKPKHHEADQMSGGGEILLYSERLKFA